MTDRVAEHTGTQLTRRAALRLVVTGAGATVLVACGVGQPGTDAVVTKPAAPAGPTTAAAATGSTQPKSGGTLRYGLASPLTSIWPVFAGTEGTQDIYDKLMTYDTNLQPVPQLIESWDLASDLQADQAEPAQGGAVSQRSRVHQ
jgi:hypothetical protein